MHNFELLKKETWIILGNNTVISETRSDQPTVILDTNRRIKKRKIDEVLANWQMYLLLLPSIIFVFIFSYIPMYGILIAFQDFDPYIGFLKSPWVGFEHFTDFFQSVVFWKLIRNTLVISITNLVVGFPTPIILALLINELRSRMFKKAVQTISYLPYFVSTVVVVGMVVQFTTPSTGIINQIIKAFGGDPINFMAEPAWFVPLYTLSGLWQYIGWSSIIYIAALSGIDPTLYEAAIMDGASRLKQMVHISIPSIMPTIIIMFIFAIGSLLSVSYEKIILMYRPITYDTADVINTYIYRTGVLGGQYSASTAIGLFQTVINCLLLVGSNYISRKTTETSLW